MELKRGVDDMKSFALFILVNIAMVAALSGPKDEVDQNLECTNDLEELMFCKFEAQNCPEYNLTMRSDSGHGEQHCNLQQCKGSSCCCSFQMILVFRETHTATVFKGGEMMGSKVISIGDSVKPRVPTNVSVKESTGNFQVMWDTTYNLQRYFGSELTASVTYHKKGDTEKARSKHVTPTKINGRNSYEIFGGDLEPSTTYMVSVKSYTEWSRCYSDSSEEVEFTTSASTVATLLAIIISLSLVAIIVSGAIYGCYVKFKTKWWDTVAKCPKPKLLDMRPREQEIFEPVLPVISSVCLEPLVPDDNQPGLTSLRDTSSGSSQQCSGISTGSSCFGEREPVNIIAGVQDALGKAYVNINTISPLTTNAHTESSEDSGLFSAPNNLCGTRPDHMRPFAFDNKTYSTSLSSFPHHITTDNSEGQTQAGMLCDSAYQPNEGACSEEQVQACVPVVSLVIKTDMSYQQCNESVEEAGCESSGEMPHS